MNNSLTLNSVRQRHDMATLLKVFKRRQSIPWKYPRTCRRSISGRDRLFRVSEEVQDALATGKPVVALETTIYTHGAARMKSLPGR